MSSARNSIFTTLGYLLGITRPGHVERHPLRGALFENAVVNEIIQFDLNRNRDAQLSFFRDNFKAEPGAAIYGGEKARKYQNGQTAIPVNLIPDLLGSRD